jgi:hypothetical protein
LLTTSENSHYAKLRPFFDGIVFLGTPHHGSALATVLRTVLRAVPTKRLQFVKELQPYYEDTEQMFKDFSKEFPVADKVISFHESIGMGYFFNNVFFFR